MLEVEEDDHSMHFFEPLEEQYDISYVESFSEEDLKMLMDRIHFSPFTRNSHEKYSILSEEVKYHQNESHVSTCHPPIQTRKSRNTMKIEVGQRGERPGNAKYQIKNRTLKRWGGLFKDMLRRMDMGRFEREEVEIIRQYCFGLGNSLTGIRRLLGFERSVGEPREKFKQILQTQTIQKSLLRELDSFGIIREIQNLRVCREYKLQLIQSILVIRDLILDPTIQLSLQS